MRHPLMIAALCLAGCDLESLEPFLQADGARAPSEDAGAADASAPDVDMAVEDPCGLGPGPDVDADRVVLVTQPFGAEAGQRNHEIRSLLLRSDGALVDVGGRLDVGGRPAQIALTPSGRYAVVTTEEGLISLVSIDGPDALAVVDSVHVPEAGLSDLVMDPSGQMAWVVRSDNNEDEGGVWGLVLGCDGSLAVAPERFGLRLAEAMALWPGDPDRAVLLGGQAVFEPLDDHDLRLLARDGAAWRQVAAVDLYHDFVNASRIAVSPDGGTVVVPNASLFSEETGQVAVLSLEGEALFETQRLMDLPDPASVYFSPDGQTMMVARPDPGRLTVFGLDADGWFQTDELRIGLVDRIGWVQRGEATGVGVAASTDPADGPQIVVLRVIGPGQVDIEERVALGAGGPNIPVYIAVRP